MNGIQLTVYLDLLPFFYFALRHTTDWYLGFRQMDGWIHFETKRELDDILWLKMCFRLKKKSNFCIFFSIEFGFPWYCWATLEFKPDAVYKLDIRNQFFILNWRWDCYHALLEYWSDAGFTEKRHLTNSCCLTKNTALESNNKTGVSEWG